MPSAPVDGEIATPAIAQALQQDFNAHNSSPEGQDGHEVPGVPARRGYLIHRQASLMDQNFDARVMEARNSLGKFSSML